MNKQAKIDATKEAISALKKRLKPGQTIYTILRKVSKSGMLRHISVCIATRNPKGQPFISDITWQVARALQDYSDFPQDYGIKVSGCGMDMGFSIIYSLGSVLFGHGKETQKHKYMTYRNGSKEPETDGGYLLKQQWL